MKSTRQPGHSCCEPSRKRTIIDATVRDDARTLALDQHADAPRIRPVLGVAFCRLEYDVEAQTGTRVGQVARKRVGHRQPP